MVLVIKHHMYVSICLGKDVTQFSIQSTIEKYQRFELHDAKRKTTGEIVYNGTNLEHERCIHIMNRENII